MGINNLPSSLQSVIQAGYLERAFQDSLTAKLGYRAVADRETFPAGIGETLTKTRPGLLPAITTPLAPASNTDITSGLTPQNFGVEQYAVSVNQFAGQMALNMVTSEVAIADLFLQNVEKLGEQAWRSLDTIAQTALFAAYMGGNTRVTANSATANVKVDDIRGYSQTINAEGQVVAVSAGNPLNVVVGANTYTLLSVTPDGTNVSTAPSGVSGTLTFTNPVAAADAVAGFAVTSAVAPKIIRPNAVATTANLTTGSLMTLQTILTAKALLESNNVPKLPNGNYLCLANPTQLAGLYQDSAFQSFSRGRLDSTEYREGVIAELLGVTIGYTNLNPVQMIGGLAVQRCIVMGAGALVESAFSPKAYERAISMDDGAIQVVEGIAHVVREPIDALKQVVTQSWSYIGGFVAPTDLTANPTTIPSATNSAYKRAVIIESV